MSPHMSWDPDGSSLAAVCTAYSSRTRLAGDRSAGNVSPQSAWAATRVPVAIPQRSMNRTVGCRETTTIEPGGSGLREDTNGWSIQPPAIWSRYGRFPMARRTPDVAGEGGEDVVARPVTRSALDDAPAGLAGRVLVGDPGVGRGHPVAERRVRL